MAIWYSQIFIIIVLIFSIFIIICIVSKIECATYEIKHFIIDTDKIKDCIRLIFVSDLHNKEYIEQNKKLVSDIVNEKPDYIIIGGDTIDFSRHNSYMGKVNIDKAIAFIETLSNEVNKKLGNDKNDNSRIYIGFGNHELRLKEKILKEYEKFISVLNKNQINILDDNKYLLNDDIILYGLSLYDGYYGKNIFNSKIKKKVDINILKDKFNIIDDKKYNILCFHKPDFFEDFSSFGFDIVLSGHNHGGLVRFPFIGAVFSPDLKIFPKYNDGMYSKNGKNLVVSKGLGEHFIKLRVNDRPDICVIEINGRNNI